MYQVTVTPPVPGGGGSPKLVYSLVGMAKNENVYNVLILVQMWSNEPETNLYDI